MTHKSINQLKNRKTLLSVHFFLLVSMLNPPNQIVAKSYSLEPDIVMGFFLFIRWKPKIKVVGPVPLNFDNELIDTIVNKLTGFKNNWRYKVVYLGFRPTDTFKLHYQFAKQYTFKYQHLYLSNYSHLKVFFARFYAQFLPQTTRMFKGTNPSLLHQNLSFDSIFEGGNLDAAVKVSNQEYDLFIRIDSNTKGHCQWYNFKVRNKIKCCVRLNICNFQKGECLYKVGMKPYVLSARQQINKRVDFKQIGYNIKFQKKPFRYHFLPNQQAFCLSFQYCFAHDDDQVQFCYCPPYNYSHLQRLLQKLSQQNHSFLTISGLCQSLTGLKIPLLTINEHKQNQNKKCILLTGRIHPGQSNGSHMMHGFLQFICGYSQSAIQLRKKCVFKIIPMMNPDGVILGNYRTSCSGRDLNRVFDCGVQTLFPQTVGLKQLVLSLKGQFGQKLVMFLDFHGHSVKRNAFVYGPQYSIWNLNYYKARVFPKILSKLTEVFRIANSKKGTARAVFLKHVPQCYTLEASNGSYYSPFFKAQLHFTIDKWKHLGQSVGVGFQKYIKSTFQQERMLQQKRRRRMKIGYLKQEAGYEQTTEQKEYLKKIIQQGQIESQDTLDNNIPQGRSDSQSPSQDHTKEYTIQMQRQIISSLNQFKSLFGKKIITQPQQPKQDNQVLETKKISIVPIQSIACLRKKLEKKNILIAPKISQPQLSTVNQTICNSRFIKNPKLKYSSQPRPQTTQCKKLLEPKVKSKFKVKEQTKKIINFKFQNMFHDRICNQTINLNDKKPKERKIFSSSKRINKNQPISNNRLKELSINKIKIVSLHVL